jgi:hypothetical protein
MLAHRSFFVLRETSRLFQARRMIPHPYVPTEPTTLLISWATADNLLHGGEFHKSFFGDLAVQLGKLGCHVAVVPMIVRGVPYKEALARLQHASLPLMVPHRYVSLMDVVRVVVSSCARPPLPRSIPALSGMDISPIVREELGRDWVSNQAADALLMAASVRRLAGLGAPISRIIYIYENQPWERALCWEARRSLPEAVMVGYQHARVPRLLLNWYLAPGGERDAPLPDRVVTVGEYSAKLLSSDGYDPDCVRIGGALQMQGLLALRPRGGESLTCGNGASTVLVACSNGLEETVELVDKAVHLFDENEGVQVVLKCHPLMPFQRVRKLIGSPLPSHVHVSEEPIADLILKSSLMVYSGSTVCVQALALGLPVVHLRTQFDFDLDPLEAVPDLRLEATGLEELRQKVRWLLEHREGYIAEHRLRWNRLVEEMYGPVTNAAIRAFVE